MTTPEQATEGRVVIMTRYETRVHARNLNADYGKPVVVYADSQQEAVNKAIAVGWLGYPNDARVTVLRVTQEPVVIPPAIPPAEPVSAIKVRKPVY